MVAEAGQPIRIVGVTIDTGESVDISATLGKNGAKRIRLPEDE